MGRYKVVMCPKCFKYQTTETNKTFKCKLCGKTSALTSRKNPMKVYGSYDTPRDAVAHCQRLMRGEKF